jgi:hypothetical protein
MLNSPEHLVQILAAGEKARSSEESCKKGAKSREQWWKDEDNKNRMNAVRKKQWEDKKKNEIKAAQEAERRVSDLREKLRQAKAELERLQGEQRSAEERVFHAVNAAVPRMGVLFSLPDIKVKPRLLIGNYSHPDFSSDEIAAAREAVISRKPAKQWPMVAARWLVALTLKYDIGTVRRYCNRAANRTTTQ